MIMYFLINFLVISHTQQDCESIKEKLVNCKIRWKCKMLNKKCNSICQPKPTCIFLDNSGNCIQKGWVSTC